MDDKIQKQFYPKVNRTEACWFFFFLLFIYSLCLSALAWTCIDDFFFHFEITQV